MLRVLGLSQRRIASAYTLEFAFVGVLASMAGVLLGLGVHNVFVWLLSGLLDARLPPPGLWPALFGLGVGLTLLLGFGLPPVLQLARVPPLRVMRRDVGNLKASSLLVLAAGTGGFAALLLAVSSDLKLGAIAVGGFAAAIGVFALLSWGAVQLLRRAGARSRRAALAAAGHAPAVGAAGLCGAAGQRAGGGPAGAGAAGAAAHRPHRRLAPAPRRPTRPTASSSTCSPTRARPSAAALEAAGVKRYDWYPMIRGRLVAINGQPVHAGQLHRRPRAAPGRPRVQPQPRRAELPPHNQLAAGRWTPDEADALSVEDGLARRWA
jgi:putative ABC transport system permease protein